MTETGSSAVCSFTTPSPRSLLLKTLAAEVLQAGCWDRAGCIAFSAVTCIFCRSWGICHRGEEQRNTSRKDREAPAGALLLKRLQGWEVWESSGAGCFSGLFPSTWKSFAFYTILPQNFPFFLSFPPHLSIRTRQYSTLVWSVLWWAWKQVFYLLTEHFAGVLMD